MQRIKVMIYDSNKATTHLFKALKDDTKWLYTSITFSQKMLWQKKIQKWSCGFTAAAAAAAAVSNNAYVESYQMIYWAQ